MFSKYIIIVGLLQKLIESDSGKDDMPPDIWLSI